MIKNDIIEILLEVCTFLVKIFFILCIYDLEY